MINNTVREWILEEKVSKLYPFWVKKLSANDTMQTELCKIMSFLLGCCT